MRGSLFNSSDKSAGLKENMTCSKKRKNTDISKEKQDCVKAASQTNARGFTWMKLSETYQNKQADGPSISAKGIGHTRLVLSVQVELYFL